MQNPIVHPPATAPKKQAILDASKIHLNFFHTRKKPPQPKTQKRPHTLYLACFKIPAHNTKPGKKRTTENKAFYSY